jgi:hypothetical protein
MNKGRYVREGRQMGIYSMSCQLPFGTLNYLCIAIIVSFHKRRERGPNVMEAALTSSTHYKCLRIQET